MDELNMDALDTSGLDTGKDDLYSGMDLYSDNGFKSSSSGQMDELPSLSELPPLPALDDLPPLPNAAPAASAAAEPIVGELSDMGVSDELPELPKLSEMSDDFGIAGTDTASMLSDMDGNGIESVPGMAPISDVQSTGDMMSSLDKTPSPQEKPFVSQQYRRYSGADYDPQNIASSRDQHGTSDKPGYVPTDRTGSPGTQYQSNLDKLYEQRFEQDYEKAEKGKQKAEILSTIGIIWYAISTILSFGLFSLIINGFIILCLVMLRKGSNKAKDILGWLSSLSCFRGIIGVFTAIVYGSTVAAFLGAAAGVITVLSSLVNVALSGYLAFQFFANEELTEYCKISHESGIGRDSDDALSRFFFRM